MPARDCSLRNNTRAVPLSLDLLLARRGRFTSSSRVSPPGILPSLPLPSLPSPASGDLPALLKLPLSLPGCVLLLLTLGLSASKIRKSFCLHHHFLPPFLFLCLFLSRPIYHMFSCHLCGTGMNIDHSHLKPISLFPQRANENVTHGIIIMLLTSLNCSQSTHGGCRASLKGRFWPLAHY